MINYDEFLSRAAGAMQESAIRRMGAVLAKNRDVISFAPGYPAPETFPWEEFRNIARELLGGEDGSVLQYGATRGYRPLLEVITGIMSSRGIASRLDRLLVTTGSQQGLDLVARVLLDPGDVVLVELPTYTGAIVAFRNAQAEMAGVPQETDGIDLAALDAIHTRLVKEGRRVRMLYILPNFQNPTGLLMGRAKRVQLLAWAAVHSILIVEDDPYRELYFEGSATEADVRPVKADDEDGRVIYLSSFSKTLAPGFRVAWIDAPAPIAMKLEYAKQAADLCSGGFDQRIIFQAARQGILDRRLPVLRAHYREKRDVMVAALQRELGDHLSWQDPRGGFFLWAKLPDGIDAERLNARAVHHGVVFVAGEAFFVNTRRPVDQASAVERRAAERVSSASAAGAGREFMRLSFSAPTLDRIEDGVVRLAAAIREERAELVTAGAVAPQPVR